MVGAAVLSWLVVAAIPALTSDREVLFGMLAPLAGAVATWVLVARTYRSQPERLTSLMVAAFARETGVLRRVRDGDAEACWRCRPVPFVISFTTYFIALHMFEALCLQRSVRRSGRFRPRNPTT